MRILMLTFGPLQSRPDAPEMGGASRQCLKLSRALVQQGQTVTILTTRIAWHDPARAVVEGVPVIYANTGRPFVNAKGLRRFGLYGYMLGALAHLVPHRRDYDVIHAHSAQLSGFLAVLGARLLKKKSLLKVMNSGARNDLLELQNTRGLVGARLMARYLRHCDAAVVLNPLAQHELLQFGFRPEQIVVIPNGVEVEDIQPQQSYSQRPPLRLIFAGRLAPSKGLERLLAAVAWLQSHRPGLEVQLTLLGRGPLQSLLQARAAALNIADRVHFQGEVADVRPFLLAADVFVLASYAEGLSNAMLEAMATGLPCITTNTPGNNTLVQPGFNGLLVEHNDDAAELAAAIEQLARDPALREKLGQAARRSVVECFDIQSTARRYVELYRRLLTTAA